MEFYLPEEYLIICTALALKTNVVKVDDVLVFMKKCPFSIEYEEGDKEFKYCTFNKKQSTFTVNFDGLHISSKLVGFSHSVWNS